ncbi:MAG: class I SAM-dependent methyltransferase [Parvularculales bacterium]
MQTINLRTLRLEDRHRLLDIGCGAGRHLHAACHHATCHAIGLDYGENNLHTTRAGFSDTTNNYSLLAGNALTLPFPDACFDRIICSEVLEHIPNYRLALYEIGRVLKPGGALAISVPRYWPEWLCWALSRDYSNEPGGHVRIFKTKVLRQAVEEQGLVYFHRHWAHGLHSPYWWIRCALGLDNTQTWLIRTYHRFLVWDMMKRPWLTCVLSWLADPLMGKSLVLYFVRGKKYPMPTARS